MPSGDEIKVEFGAVEGAGAAIKSTAQAMDAELDALRAQLAPLAEAYQGTARDMWHQTQTSWDNAQNELNQVLAQIGAATSQAAQDYQATEKGVAGLWG